MSELSDSDVDERLRGAVGYPATADFDAWRERHQTSIAYLNPIVAAAYHRRRRLWVGIAGTAAAAAVVILGTLLFVRGGQTFAQTIAAIQRAESISWSITWYNRMMSRDGKRTWLEKAPRWERSYLAPDRWRDVRFDADDNVATIDIEDAAAGQVLHLDMKRKTATLKQEPSGQFGVGGGPFANLTRILEREPIELVGQRDLHGRKVTVFRHRREFIQGNHELMEIWLDAASKRLVGYCITSADEPFDATTDRDRDNRPEPSFSKVTIAGVINDTIDFDAGLDPKLFSLTPPDGFEVIEAKPRPKVTEEALLEWLRAAAEANGNVFIDMEPRALHAWQSAVYDKEEGDLTAAERRFLAVERKHARDGNIVPRREFEDAFTMPGSFRYLGKGTKLGDGNRIVCFYKLASTGRFRAIFGDLRVADVEPAQLPLPVEQ